ncbi:KH domain-containing protein [Mammaliicoccus sp. Dog046]|uniref:KH domain-containing protein n=1 Tax=Mammaliicoccus sp. Dog046 TaxID=3034233 RepID=UPI002B25948A|nr:KH domain-containing protein [Mammaliicoccus sp. Dog046]WQK84571.1 KH domain-containing protein [Mammaliicoccus sp. Dog046]
MEKLIQTIIVPLVDYPESINISKDEQDSSITFNIDVHEEDIGRIIGKKGRMIKAIRTIVSGSMNEYGKKVFVEVN